MKLVFTQKESSYAKSILLAIFCIVASQTLSAQICASPNTIIYGLDGSGNIYPINVTNANVGSLVNTANYSTATTGYTPSSPSQPNGFGYNTANGLFYYFKINPGTGSQQFISYNPTTNKYLTLAPSPTTATVHAGCVNFNGTGYYCTDVNGKLFYYNILLNIWTTITSTIKDQSGNNVSTIIQTQNSGDMAVDGLGNLWILTSSSSNYALYEIMAPLPVIPATILTPVIAKQIIAPTTATPGGASFEGIAFNPLGEIYMATSNDKLYLLKTATTLTLVGTLSKSGVGNDLTSCSFPNSVLPVSWETFTASLEPGKTVLLNWTVAQQTNNKGYSIERSSDGANWESIGFRDDVEGENSSATYSFTDANPVSGKNYYRIHQEDLNGNSSYSIIQTLDIETTGTVAVWPNPAKNIVNIKQGGNSEVFNINAEIFNQSGQKVSVSQLHSGINTVNIASLPSGFYIVHIDLSNGESYNQKLVKL